LPFCAADARGFEWAVRCPLRYTHLSNEEYQTVRESGELAELPSYAVKTIEQMPKWFGGLPVQSIDLTEENAVTVDQHTDPNTIVKYRSQVSVCSYDDSLDTDTCSVHAFMADAKTTRLGYTDAGGGGTKAEVIALTLFPVHQISPQVVHEPGNTTMTYADHPLSGKTTLRKMSSTHTGDDYKTAPTDLVARKTTEIGVLKRG
jgi:hypothetical protein